MKRLLFVFVIVCLTIVSFAQTDYYSETKLVVYNGNRYQCNATAWGFVELYNAANTMKGRFPALLSTGETYIEPEDGFHPVMEYDSQMFKKAEDIIRNVFSNQQRSSCKGDNLYVTCYINSRTGKIEELLFEFSRQSNLVNIPISVFYTMESDLKRNIQYGITELGKQLDFVYLNIDVEL